MDTELDEHLDSDLDEPGPRLARTLAEQAAAAEASRTRLRRVLGASFMAIGLAIAALAAWSVLRPDPAPERKVGKLTSSNLTGTTAPKSGTSSGSGSKTTPTATGSAPASTPPTTAATAPTGKAVWPGAARGRPAAFGRDGDAPPASAGDLEDGFYLWEDFKGWHLWLVGGTGSDASAELVVDQDIPRADPVGGSPAVSSTGNHITVARGSESAAVTGVDFSVGFYAKTMVVTITGDLPLHIGMKAKPTTSILGLQRSLENR